MIIHFEDHLRPHIEADPNGGCWLWAGQKMGADSRYGRFPIGPRKGRAAHSVVWECLVGPIPENWAIRRLCGVQLCVNPQHMRLVETPPAPKAIFDDEDADLAAICTSSATGANGARYAAVTAGPMKKKLSHRLILSRKLGRDLVAGEDVDHVDGDTLNNRRSNLRLATRSQNNGNRRKGPKPTSSRFKGVSLHKAKGCRRVFWAAYVTKDRHREFLGLFVEEEAAARAYDKAAARVFGEFALLNFPAAERAA